MPSQLRPERSEAYRAARLLASALEAAASQANRDGQYIPPSGVGPVRRRRKAGSLRHLAEVIRGQRLSPGIAVDKDIVAAVLDGDLKYITNPTLVLAVARACHIIAGRPLSDADARRLVVACARVNALIEEARLASSPSPRTVLVPRPPGTLRVPHRRAVARRRPVQRALVRRVLPPDVARRDSRGYRWAVRRTIASIAVLLLAVLTLSIVAHPASVRALAGVFSANDASCHADTEGEDIVDATTVFTDDDATRLTPTLDFDSMNGSARYASYHGRIYYWGRAGSDDDEPHSGGASVRWRTDGPWHNCSVTLAVSDRGYVHTPAVATTIGGRAVTLAVCLWRDHPYRRNCTPDR